LAKKKIHIDDLFRRELSDMKMPVDTKDWAAMQAQIAAAQNKRKGRVLWWWFAGIALLIVSSLTAYYLISPENENDKNSANAINQTTILPESKRGDNKNSPLLEKENTNISLGNNTQEKGAPTKPQFGSVENGVNPSYPKHKQANTPKLESNTTGFNEPPIPTLEEKKNKSNKTDEVKKGDEQENAKDETDFLPKEESVSTPLINKTDPLATTTEIAANSKTEEPKEVKTNETVDTANNTKKISRDSNSTATKRKTQGNSSLSPFSLGFSLGSATNSFTANENSDFGRILNTANQPALGFNAQVTANYRIKNFEINTGVGINSITNSGNYNYTRQTFDSIPVLNPQGTIIGYFYTNFRDTTHNFSLQSKFTSIVLPIGISYTIKINDNSGLRVGVNTSIHYLVGTSGEYINPFNLFRLDVNANKKLFRKWNIGMAGTVGYYYKINEQLTFEGSLNYSILTNGIFDSRIGTAIRPTSIGVNVGLRYNFKLKK